MSGRSESTTFGELSQLEQEAKSTSSESVEKTPVFDEAKKFADEVKKTYQTLVDGTSTKSRIDKMAAGVKATGESYKILQKEIKAKSGQTLKEWTEAYRDARLEKMGQGWAQIARETFNQAKEKKALGIKNFAGLAARAVMKPTELTVGFLSRQFGADLLSKQAELKLTKDKYKSTEVESKSPEKVMKQEASEFAANLAEQLDSSKQLELSAEDQEKHLLAQAQRLIFGESSEDGVKGGLQFVGEKAKQNLFADVSNQIKAGKFQADYTKKWNDISNGRQRGFAKAYKNHAELAVAIRQRNSAAIGLGMRWLSGGLAYMATMKVKGMSRALERSYNKELVDTKEDEKLGTFDRMKLFAKVATKEAGKFVGAERVGKLIASENEIKDFANTNSEQGVFDVNTVVTQITEKYGEQMKDKGVDKKWVQKHIEKLSGLAPEKQQKELRSFLRHQLSNSRDIGLQDMANSVEEVYTKYTYNITYLRMAADWDQTVEGITHVRQRLGESIDGMSENLGSVVSGMKEQEAAKEILPGNVIAEPLNNIAIEQFKSAASYILGDEQQGKEIQKLEAKRDAILEANTAEEIDNDRGLLTELASLAHRLDKLMVPTAGAADTESFMQEVEPSLEQEVSKEIIPEQINQALIDIGLSVDSEGQVVVSLKAGQTASHVLSRARLTETVAQVGGIPLDLARSYVSAEYYSLVEDLLPVDAAEMQANKSYALDISVLQEKIGEIKQEVKVQQVNMPEPIAFMLSTEEIRNATTDAIGVDTSNTSAMTFALPKGGQLGKIISRENVEDIISSVTGKPEVELSTAKYLEFLSKTVRRVKDGNLVGQDEFSKLRPGEVLYIDADSDVPRQAFAVLDMEDHWPEQTFASQGDGESPNIAWAAYQAAKSLLGSIGREAEVGPEPEERVLPPSAYPGYFYDLPDRVAPDADFKAYTQIDFADPKAIEHSAYLADLQDHPLYESLAGLEIPDHYKLWLMIQRGEDPSATVPEDMKMYQGKARAYCATQISLDYQQMFGEEATVAMGLIKEGGQFIDANEFKKSLLAWGGEELASLDGYFRLQDGHIIFSEKDGFKNNGEMSEGYKQDLIEYFQAAAYTDETHNPLKIGTSLYENTSLRKEIIKDLEVNEEGRTTDEGGSFNSHVFHLTGEYRKMYTVEADDEGESFQKYIAEELGVSQGVLENKGFALGALGVEINGVLFGGKTGRDFTEFPWDAAVREGTVVIIHDIKTKEYLPVSDSNPKGQTNENDFITDRFLRSSSFWPIDIIRPNQQIIGYELEEQASNVMGRAVGMYDVQEGDYYNDVLKKQGVESKDWSLHHQALEIFGISPDRMSHYSTVPLFDTEQLREQKADIDARYTEVLDKREDAIEKRAEIEGREVKAHIFRRGETMYSLLEDYLGRDQTDQLSYAERIKLERFLAAKLDITVKDGVPWPVAGQAVKLDINDPELRGLFDEMNEARLEKTVFIPEKLPWYDEGEIKWATLPEGYREMMQAAARKVGDPEIAFELAAEYVNERGRRGIISRGSIEWTLDWLPEGINPIDSVGILQINPAIFFNGGNNTKEFFGKEMSYDVLRDRLESDPEFNFLAAALLNKDSKRNLEAYLRASGEEYDETSWEFRSAAINAFNRSPFVTAMGKYQQSVKQILEAVGDDQAKLIGQRADYYSKLGGFEETRNPDDFPKIRGRDLDLMADLSVDAYELIKARNPEIFSDISEEDFNSDLELLRSRGNWLKFLRSDTFQAYKQAYEQITEKEFSLLATEEELKQKKVTYGNYGFLAMRGDLNDTVSDYSEKQRQEVANKTDAGVEVAKDLDLNIELSTEG
ncbi:hypothetical protein ACFL2B_03010 [Patescibacteria group bacterium]